jgi:hypothetical protein
VSWWSALHPLTPQPSSVDVRAAAHRSARLLWRVNASWDFVAGWIYRL